VWRKSWVGSRSSILAERVPVAAVAIRHVTV
jgi:hypothetical protein